MSRPVVAEQLSPKRRHALVRRLVADGLTDAEIAARTAMTTYTTARIRAALGLPPNPRKDTR